MAFKEGQAVRQVAPVIEGTISDIQYNKGSEQLEYKVDYVDGEGEAQSRWFNEADLVAVGGA